MHQYDETTEGAFTGTGDPFAHTDGSFESAERLALGVDRLDMKQPYGVKKGSVLSILGDPRGMGDLFLVHLIRTGRPTTYVSTVRPERSIRDELSMMGDGEAENLTFVETFSVEEEPEAILGWAANRTDVGHNLILDTVTNLFGSEETDRLLDSLRPVCRTVAEKDALACLYFASAGLDGLTRSERELLHLSDAVFDVRSVTHNDKLQTHVEILKLRGSELPEKVIRFTVGECLREDTSRDLR